jgi:hypothetical protein
MTEPQMTEPQMQAKPQSWMQGLRWLIGAAAAAALLLWIDRTVGWTAIWQPWQHMALGTLMLALLTQLLSYGLRAARLAQLEPEIGWRGLPRCLALVLVHNLFNLLLPMRSGEASFPLLMRREFGADPVRASGLLLWLRICDLHVLASLALLAAAFSGAAQTLAGGLGLLLLGAAALAPLPLLFAAAPLSRRLRGESRAMVLLRRILAGLPAQPHYWGLSLGWTWLSWSLKLAGLGALLAGFAQCSFALGALGAIGGDLSSVLPIHAPAGLGTYEAGAAALAHAFGGELALAPLFNLHLFLLGVALAAGAVAAAALAMLPGRHGAGHRAP